MTVGGDAEVLHVRSEELLTAPVRQDLDREHAESVAHALVDIGGSIEKTCGMLLPDRMRVLDQPNAARVHAVRLEDETRHPSYGFSERLLTREWRNEMLREYAARTLWLGSLSRGDEKRASAPHARPGLAG